MSGTSLDGVDIAIVDFSGEAPVLLSSHFRTYPKGLLSAMKTTCSQNNILFDDLGRLDSQLGDFYAESIIQTLTKAKLQAKDIIAIGSHGQTIQHSPNSTPSYTLQIGDANRIAEGTGISVVADFRRRDIAAGGQGAPLVSAFHKAVFQNTSENLAVINIGGISNVTFLSNNRNSPIIGFDCGPGNTLMDQWCQLHFAKSYDKSGELSKAGSINKLLLNSLLSDQYFQLTYPKSTGPEYFNLSWLSTHLDKYPSSIQDTLSTLCELTAACIAESLARLPSIDKALICGGGVHNEFLLQRLKARLSCTVETTGAYGVEPDWVEAMAFAWLAKQTLEGKPGNVPSVTGAKNAVVLGAIYSA
ncbi:MAG: anhydro-N-acetylmuramic acid kinase [Cycloclasticus sp.]|jgi:anhydro-N-acetylmuramic acid kinase